MKIKWKRKCSNPDNNLKCLKSIEYKSEKTFLIGIEKNTLCNSCSNYGKNNGLFKKSLIEIWEEKFGKEIAEQKRIQKNKKIGIKNSGKNNGMYGKKGIDNPFYNKKHTKENIEILRKKSKDFSNDKKERLKRKKRMMGEKNPAKLPDFKYKSFFTKHGYTYQKYLDALPEWERYKINVINETNKNIYLVENVELRGNDYHLDHIVSVWYGFKNNISEKLIGSINNLKIIPKKDNLKKREKLTQEGKEILKYWDKTKTVR